ncbi:hypothetical protein BU15DRAFT_69104 [Melanogaster broomeanus]|nr:hypothetical protein BU15DRAFT_69104 [Melanogaster broomeanus]
MTVLQSSILAKWDEKTPTGKTKWDERDETRRAKEGSTTWLVKCKKTHTSVCSQQASQSGCWDGILESDERKTAIQEVKGHRQDLYPCNSHAELTKRLPRVLQCSLQVMGSYGSPKRRNSLYRGGKHEVEGGNLSLEGKRRALFRVRLTNGKPMWGIPGEPPRRQPVRSGLKAPWSALSRSLEAILLKSLPISGSPSSAAVLPMPFP